MYLRKSFFVFIWFCVLFLACNENVKFTANFTGTSECIGATIFCDEEKIGVFEERIYTGPDNRLKKGEKFAILRVKIKEGQHRLKVVGINGKQVSIDVQIKNESYFMVDLEKNAFQGG